VGDVVVRVRLLRGPVRVLVAPLRGAEITGLVGEDRPDERLDRLRRVLLGRWLPLRGRLRAEWRRRGRGGGDQERAPQDPFQPQGDTSAGPGIATVQKEPLP